jgi:ABC-type xylose transport system permease subunit
MSTPNEPNIDRPVSTSDLEPVVDVEITQQVRIGKFKIPTEALRAYTMMFALVAIWLFFQWATIDARNPYGLFLSGVNFSKLMQQTAVTGVLAVGMLMW